MVSYVCNTQSMEQAKTWLDCIFKNIHNQYYRTILPIVTVDQAIADSINDYCSKNCASAKVVSMRLFDICGAREMTDGQAIAKIRAMFAHDYFINTNAAEVWFYDHITTLVHAIENENAEGAYSGQLFYDCNDYSQVHSYETATVESISTFSEDGLLPHLEKFPFPGCFLFKSNCHKYVPDYLFDCLDGREHIAYANLLMIKHGMKLAFTKRMTFSFHDNYSDARNVVVNKEQERRFITDLTKYDTPISLSIQRSATSGVAVTSIASRKDLAELISLLPIKSYIKMRYYRSRLRKVDASSPKGKRLSLKYNQAKAEYNRLVGD